VNQIDGVKIFFQTRNDKGQTNTRTLTLRGVTGQVEIAIKNREIQELLGVRVPKVRNSPDVDFRAYYDLSSASVAVAQALLPHDVSPFFGPASLSVGGVCPPTAFSGTATLASPTTIPAPASAPQTLKAVATEIKAAKTLRTRRRR
jgi:hypothetical protein